MAGEDVTSFFVSSLIPISEAAQFEKRLTLVC